MKQELIDLFEDISGTCFRNDLSMEYADHVGELTVSKVKRGSAGNLRHDKIAESYIKNWRHDDPEDELNRVLHEVENYLEGRK